MKVIICAIAKNEDKYISDFCKYHLALGFDEIHIYDNGTKIPINDERIIIHPFKNVENKCPQLVAYNDFLKTVDYDWVTFIDIDEFITLDEYNNIKDYLMTFPEKVDSIRLYEKVYGDDGKIIPDNINVPIYNRIMTYNKNINVIWGKSIIKKHDSWKIINPHKIVLENEMCDAYSDRKISDYRTPPQCICEDEAVFDNCYIRHYKTKTLSEFCDQKLNTPRVFDQAKKRTIDYYFQINEKTPEKIAYLKERGIEIK